LRNASVKIRGLKKTFDNGVVAVDDLSVTFVPGQVSALLGHNGAGKTTTISMLTGMLDATGGDAFINNRSIKTDMPAIRASLGICPQFDVLWPMMTVREHLTLYAAFGGMKSEETKRAVVDAVAEVALLEKLDVPTGNLSGGQKRKLSLAIAFVTRPDVVFLDEPTSGMDPYSRRFTWEVIRRRAATSSIMLTTHFLDEADLLCDRIAIMSAGKLACVGSPLFLKNRYGTGYTLTLARASSNPNGGADAILSVVKSHLPGAVVTSDVGAELAVMLPSEGSGKFASLFKELDGAIKSAGFASYGISCTTLEEVFLSIARGGVGGGAASRRMSLDGKNAKMVDDGAVDGDSADGTPLMADDHDADRRGGRGFKTGVRQGSRVARAAGARLALEAVPQLAPGRVVRADPDRGSRAVLRVGARARRLGLLGGHGFRAHRREPREPAREHAHRDQRGQLRRRRRRRALALARDGHSNSTDARAVARVRV
jgi:ABC-type multidrug transport system ATPase subunit